LAPKKPNKRIVIGRFAQGLARRKLTTAGPEAPFLCSSMQIARIP